MGGYALAKQRLGGAAPNRRAELLVDVQPLSGSPAVDHGVDVGHHGLHIVLYLSVTQPGRHDAATTLMVRAVANDQGGRPVNDGQALKSLPPAERIGVGEHELVGLGSQQVRVAVPADPGIDHRTPPPIQREQRLAGKVRHRPVRLPSH